MSRDHDFYDVTNHSRHFFIFYLFFIVDLDSDSRHIYLLSNDFSFISYTLPIFRSFLNIPSIPRFDYTHYLRSMTEFRITLDYTGYIRDSYNHLDSIANVYLMMAQLRQLWFYPFKFATFVS